MDYSTPPGWVMDIGKLQQILKHQRYLAQGVSNFVDFQDIAALESGVRQYLYWKAELTPSVKANSLLFSFLGTKGLVNFDVINICKALRPIADLSKSLEYFKGAHSAFLGISFSSQAEVSKIVNTFHYYQDTIVVFITHSTSYKHDFRLLWLPPLFEVERVHHLLDAYTSSYEIKRESIPTGEGTYSPTNIVRGTLAPKSGKTIKDIPHLVKLPAPHRGCALLIVSGRDPLCLKCREIGHLRVNCPLSKCILCLKLHFPHSQCGTSAYAEIAGRNVSKLASDDWLDHTDDGESPVSSPEVNNFVTPDSQAYSMAYPQLLLSDLSVDLHTVSSPESNFSFSDTGSSPVDSRIVSSPAGMVECDRTILPSPDRLVSLPPLDGNHSTSDSTYTVIPQHVASPCTSGHVVTLVPPSSSSVVSLDGGGLSSIPPRTLSFSSRSPSFLTSDASAYFGELLLSSPAKKRRSRSCSPLGRGYISSKPLLLESAHVLSDSISSPISSSDSPPANTIAEPYKDAVHEIAALDFREFCPRSALITYKVHSTPVLSALPDYSCPVEDEAKSAIPLFAPERVLDPLLDLSLAPGLGSPSTFPMEEESFSGTRKRKTVFWGDTESEEGSTSGEASMFVGAASTQGPTEVPNVDDDTSIPLEPQGLLVDHDSLVSLLIDRTDISVGLAASIEEACPSQLLTADIVSKLLLMHKYGIPPAHVLTRMRVLTMSKGVMMKKLKKLALDYGGFASIHDLVAGVKR